MEIRAVKSTPAAATLTFRMKKEIEKLNDVTWPKYGSFCIWHAYILAFPLINIHKFTLSSF